MFNKNNKSKQQKTVRISDGFSLAKKQKNLARKSDDAMFLPLAKAMCLRRDVCLRHVADNREGSPPSIYKNNRKSGCFLSMMNEKKHTKPPKRGQTDTGVEPYYFFNYSSKC